MKNDIGKMEKSYGFESIRAKILYASNLHEIPSMPSGSINYGSSIDRLADMLESDQLR